ncbi:MAG: hypothetical protein PVJ57_04705 [Phycisphaerae bacterium]|jgi:hypothetical protein
MSADTPAIDLSRLDAVEPLVPDPDIWADNLAALRKQQPELAVAVECTAVPADWRPVRALDGWPTYRTERPGNPAAWLSGSAVPTARAEALLTGFQLGELNLSIPALLVGAELGSLLERLPYYRAVYVFEPDLAVLAAVLRVVRVAEAVASMRCILAQPGAEHASLSRLLSEHTGLLPPGNIVVLPGVAAARLEQVRAVCERLAQEVSGGRSARMKELAVPAAGAAGALPERPRVAVLALTPDSTARATAVAVEQATKGLGWPVLRRALTGPVDVGMLPHYEALAEFTPDVTLCVRQVPGRLPVPLPGVVCEWVQDCRDVPARLPADGVLRLAASPRIATALRAAAPEGIRVGEWYWGCAAQADADLSPPVREVWLIADYPDDSAAACGAGQPSHQQLWTRLQQQAARVWDTRDVLHPAGLLAHAERQAGAGLGDAALRARFIERIELALIPVAILERIGQAIAASLGTVQVIGNGWARRPGKEIEVLARSAFDVPAGRRPMAAIFAGGTDPLTPALLHAGASGWPLLLHSPGGQSRTAALGGILEPQQHYLPFAGLNDLSAALQQEPRTTDRRADRTRRHLRKHHSYAQRLEALRAVVQNADGSA